jgi:hypothetical protein
LVPLQERDEVECTNRFQIFMDSYVFASISMHVGRLVLRIANKYIDFLVHLAVQNVVFLVVYSRDVNPFVLTFVTARVRLQ